jgi:hypothetical protein
MRTIHSARVTTIDSETEKLGVYECVEDLSTDRTIYARQFFYLFWREPHSRHFQVLGANPFEGLLERKLLHMYSFGSLSRVRGTRRPRRAGSAIIYGAR